MVRIECSAIERELEARKSDLAAAEAFYLRTLHGPRVEEISVGVANVNLAEARLQEAEKALQRGAGSDTDSRGLQRDPVCPPVAQSRFLRSANGWFLQRPRMLSNMPRNVHLGTAVPNPRIRA